MDVLRAVPCFTRIVFDGDAIELAELDDARRRIRAALRSLPEEERKSLTEALLNYALFRAERGEQIRQ